MVEHISLMTFPMDIDVAMGKLTIPDILSAAGEVGLSAVDVMNLSGKRLEEYKAALLETGIRPCCYIGSVSFFSGDPGKIEAVLKRHLEAAVALGAQRFMIVPVNPQRDRKICEKLGKAQVQALLKRYFSFAVSLGDRVGMPVCFETTPQDYTCLSGTEDCRWILQQVPGLGLVYDTANMLPHGDDPLEYYEALKSSIVHVHVKDVALSRPTWKDRLFHSEQTQDGLAMKCCLTGSGVIPIREILKRMQQDGYSGMYALEYSHPANYPADRDAHIRRLREHLTFFENTEGNS